MASYTRKQWLTLIVFSIAQFCNAICVSIQAPFYPHEAELKGATATQYSFVFSVFELTVFIVSPIYGTYLETIGVNFLNNAGVFTVSVSCILFGFINRIDGTTMFLTYSFIIRMVEACGSAAFVTTAFSIIAQEFPNNVASAFSTIETFFGLGLVAGPTLGGALYELGGFTLPFVTLGCLLMTAAFAVWFFLPKEVTGNRPRSQYSLLTLLRQPRIALSAATITFGSISIGFLMSTLEPHIRPLHLSPFQIGLVFVLNGLSYALSAPIWGRLCDKILPERIATTIGAVIVVISFLLIGPCPLLPLENSVALCVTALVIHGVGFGAQLVATFSWAHKDALEAGLPDDITSYGLVSGIWTSSFALGAFIGPSLGGILYDTIGFGWGTSVVALLHFLLAVTTCFSACFCKIKPIHGRTTERTSLLGTSIGSDEVDSTYGSASHSAESIAVKV